MEVEQQQSARDLAHQPFHTGLIPVTHCMNLLLAFIRYFVRIIRGKKLFKES